MYSYNLFGFLAVLLPQLCIIASGQGYFSVITGNTADEFGNQIAYVGDVNNDGYDDILIGDKNGGSDLVFGNASIQSTITVGTATYPTLMKFVSPASDLAGLSVSSAGDVNNDGVLDMIIGAPGYNSEKGAAYIIFGGITHHSYLSKYLLPKFYFFNIFPI